MAQEGSDTGQDNKAPGAPRPSKKEVDLFPALIDRKVVPVPAARHGMVPHIGAQISMFMPVSFDEALDIVECLRGRAAATICLEKMRRADANRLVDFVAGASAAIDGDFIKLSDHVYLFCPSNVRIVAPGQNSASSRTAISPLDFIYPERSSGDRALGGLWSKS